MTFATTWNDRARDASFVPVRLALGSAMVYHGASKLRGDGTSQTAQMFEQLGIKPGRRWALATGIAEAFAGVASILGVLTRPAALAVLLWLPQLRYRTARHPIAPRGGGASFVHSASAAAAALVIREHRCN